MLLEYKARGGPKSVRWYRKSFMYPPSQAVRGSVVPMATVSSDRRMARRNPSPERAYFLFVFGVWESPVKMVAYCGKLDTALDAKICPGCDQKCHLVLVLKRLKPCAPTTEAASP